MSELKQFRLPDVGEGLTEADIVKWHVQPGDNITINQVIVEIETAKAVVELPSPFAGVVSRILVAEGTTVDVGTPIVSVTVGEGAAVAPAQAPPEATPPAGEQPGDGEKPQAVLVGYGVKLGRTTRRPRKPSGPPSPAPSPTASPANGTRQSRAGAGGQVLAKPPVRKLAKDLGVDLGVLAGSGPHGSITREDVQQAAVAPAGQDLAGIGAWRAAATAGPREERIPIRGVRKHTAAAVSGSAFTAPHVTEFLQVDVTPTTEALERIRELPEFDGLRVSPLLLAARALIASIARHPMINSTWDEQAQEIVVHHYVNLGIAAATDRGLIVPNVKDAQALSLPELAQALGNLAHTARAGKASQADLRDGTITITNVGVFGVDSGTPILTPGEAAILALGQIRDMPWVHNGELAIRKVTTLALSFDHRIVDGDLGSVVLREVGSMLEDPLRILAWT